MLLVRRGQEAAAAAQAERSRALGQTSWSVLTMQGVLKFEGLLSVELT